AGRSEGSRGDRRGDPDLRQAAPGPLGGEPAQRVGQGRDPQGSQGRDSGGPSQALPDPPGGLQEDQGLEVLGRGRREGRGRGDPGVSHPRLHEVGGSQVVRGGVRPSDQGPQGGGIDGQGARARGPAGDAVDTPVPSGPYGYTGPIGVRTTTPPDIPGFVPG